MIRSSYSYGNVSVLRSFREANNYKRHGLVIANLPAIPTTDRSICDLRKGRSNIPMKKQLTLSIVLVLFHAMAFAVGTWGGGEPPSQDDGVFDAKWWMGPVAILFLFGQFAIFAKWPVQAFAGLFILIIAGTVDRWFGASPAVVVAVLSAIYLFRKLQPNDHVSIANDKSDVDIEARVIAIPETPPAMEHDSPPPTAPTDRKEINRIAELRRRIDRETRNNQK